MSGRVGSDNQLVTSLLISCYSKLLVNIKWKLYNITCEYCSFKVVTIAT